VVGWVGLNRVTQNGPMDNSRRIATPPEEDQVAAMGNMRGTVGGENRTCGSGDILADGHTDRHARYSTLRVRCDPWSTGVVCGSVPPGSTDCR